MGFLGFGGGGVERPEADDAIDEESASSVSDVESTDGTPLRRYKLASGTTMLDARVVGSLARADLPDLRDVLVEGATGTKPWGGITGGRFCGPREGDAYAGLLGTKP